MEITASYHYMKLSIDEFTNMISQEEWDRIYKKLAENASTMIQGNPEVKYDDNTECEGHMEFSFIVKQ